jgi:sulfide:quinone oxidoreductase
VRAERALRETANVQRGVPLHDEPMPGELRIARDRFRVVIAGGGVAALEAVLALRSLVGHVIDLTLISPEPTFTYRPVTVAEPFGRGAARMYRLDEILADTGGGRLVADAIQRVDGARLHVLTVGGEQIPFDALVLAPGAIAHEALPGAVTFRGRGDVPDVERVLADLVEGRARSVALVLPAEGTWPLPVYELAAMTASHLRQHDSRARVMLVTPELEPLELFGPAARAAVVPMLQMLGVELHTQSLPARIEGRALVLAGGARLHADRVIAMPVLRGPRIAGLPHDGDGFIPVDAHGRVRGVDHVYAAGDATTFPLKQGGLAAQQADAAAHAIAALAGAAVKPLPFRPVLRGLLLTGGAPLYLRAQPQRLSRQATVAIEASDRGGHDGPGHLTSAAAGQPLWWPPGKIAGRYLAPYLATARPIPLATGLMEDREAICAPPGRSGGDEASDAEEALALALLLADCDARWGDHRSALAALEAAEAIGGSLPTEYEHKRREWLAATDA